MVFNWLRIYVDGGLKRKYQTLRKINQRQNNIVEIFTSIFSELYLNIFTFYWGKKSINKWYCLIVKRFAELKPINERSIQTFAILIKNREKKLDHRGSKAKSAKR